MCIGWDWENRVGDASRSAREGRVASGAVGTGHSDMCGCKKCSHGARAKPTPRPKPPRAGPRQTQGRCEEEGREEVGGAWGGEIGRGVGWEEGALGFGDYLDAGLPVLNRPQIPVLLK
jgi:hypothetical protein